MELYDINQCIYRLVTNRESDPPFKELPFLVETETNGVKRVVKGIMDNSLLFLVGLELSRSTTLVYISLLLPRTLDLEP